MSTHPLSLVALAASLALAGCGDPAGTAGDGPVLTDGGTAAHDLASGARDMAGLVTRGPLLDHFIGLNGFPDDPVDTLSAAVGAVREYHNWQWCEGNGDPNYPGYPNNLNSFRLFSFDAFYTGLAAKNVDVMPCVQGGINWIDNWAVPPVPRGADPTDPKSYVAHADQMFQIAARYGATQVADGKLKLAMGETRVSGLNAIHYYEDFNEEDAWWVNGKNTAIVTPPQYAAMASADRDGDQGRLGGGFGVKTADPSARLVMGGLAGGPGPWLPAVTSYLDGIRAWAATHRAGDFPADVINVHRYSWNTDPKGPALSPEADQLKEKTAQIVAYRDQHLPDREIWITEFGYDTDGGSILRAPAIGPTPAPIVQGQWIIRSYLALLAAGFDRAYLFVSRDDCGSGCATQFATSGLMTGKGTGIKPAYYMISAFHRRLAKMALLGEQASGRPNVMIYKFADVATGRGAYVVWSPTSDGTVTKAYPLALAASTTTASAAALVDQQLNGIETALVIQNGATSIDVSETPTIVLVDHID